MTETPAVPAGATATVPTFRHGAGRPCLDFVRTLRHRGTPRQVEELAVPAALAAWIDRFGPPGDRPCPLPTATQLQRAREVREAAYRLIVSARGPGGPASCPAAAREVVNEAAGHPPPAPALDAAGRLRWYAGQPVPAMLALLARDALELAGSPVLRRVRGCANPGCGALFLDSSRPGTRRWCSMDTCGNQAKKHTLRTRSDRPA
jgi:predicted RNA-binding Zn ribbon-like protein